MSSEPQQQDAQEEIYQLTGKTYFEEFPEEWDEPEEEEIK